MGEWSKDSMKLDQKIKDFLDGMFGELSLDTVGNNYLIYAQAQRDLEDMVTTEVNAVEDRCSCAARGACYCDCESCQECRYI